METLPEVTEIPLAGIVTSENPFPHFSIDRVLLNDSATELLAWFETTDLWSFTKTNFYTQYEFSLVSLDLPEPLKFLNREATLNYLSENFGAHFGKSLKVIDITVHKLINGHKMGVHNDFIGSAETHRLVVQINDHWSDEKGGYLMLFNSKAPTDVAKIIRPLHNTGIGFEISDRSYHAVSAVHDFTRYTLVYTFNAVD
ncbi:cyclophane-containing peptide 2OG-Fe(II) oxygenase YhhC [Mucilaginibacter sp. AW1-7]|uniref:cyclophane-containing peptide 2OG-Fe(II) oxygenase YhhC n=1 Tax=Mucilaginibacter sp. AW1-7 TaxID=3349874 RepID=UPI003F73A0E2